MNIEFRTEDLSKISFRKRRYRPDLDDITSIISDVCNCIDGRAKFTVSGFGQDPWPVDVRTDFAVFLEQLPEALRSVKSLKPFALDFYEQGVERKLMLEPIEGKYKITCQSYLHWQPNPEIEYMEHGDLSLALMKIKESFLRVIEVISPNLLGHKWVRAWSE
jgi:hypothetical protein